MKANNANSSSVRGDKDYIVLVWDEASLGSHVHKAIWWRAEHQILPGAPLEARVRTAHSSKMLALMTPSGLGLKNDLKKKKRFFFLLLLKGSLQQCPTHLLHASSFAHYSPTHLLTLGNLSQLSNVNKVPNVLIWSTLNRRHCIQMQ